VGPCTSLKRGKETRRGDDLRRALAAGSQNSKRLPWLPLRGDFYVTVGFLGIWPPSGLKSVFIAEQREQGGGIGG